LVLGVPLTFFTFWIYRGIKWTILKQLLIQATLFILASMIVYVFFLRGIEMENIVFGGWLLIAYLTVISAHIGYLFANRKLH
jgi:hypothetical protein